MKLSEAMMLGSTTVKMIRFDLKSCALGAAANAIGIPITTLQSENPGLRGLLIAEKWPWITDRYTARNPWSTYGSHIAQEFNSRVCGGWISFEALVDHVRSIEPECGECNRFECTCVRVQEDTELERDGMSATLDLSGEPQLTAKQHLYQWYKQTSALRRSHSAVELDPETAAGETQQENNTQEQPSSPETTTTERQPNEVFWKYLKKLSQEGHPSGEKFVDLADDEHYREFLRQEGVSSGDAPGLGPISFFSSPRTMEVRLYSETPEEDLLSPRQIDARRHNERFQNSNSSPKAPPQESDNAQEKPSFPETTTTETKPKEKSK